MRKQKKYDGLENREEITHWTRFPNLKEGFIFVKRNGEKYLKFISYENGEREIGEKLDWYDDVILYEHVGYTIDEKVRVLREFLELYEYDDDTLIEVLKTIVNNKSEYRNISKETVLKLMNREKELNRRLKQLFKDKKKEKIIIASTSVRASPDDFFIFNLSADIELNLEVSMSINDEVCCSTQLVRFDLYSIREAVAELIAKAYKHYQSYFINYDSAVNPDNDYSIYIEDRVAESLFYEVVNE